MNNETPGWDVFFDNLSIKHYTGPLLEETHYYPFGLTMAGISSKALKPNYVENKKNKFQNQEFNNDLAVDICEFKYRMDDPQIGRFWQIDPLANKYVYNSPYAFSENKVTGHVELEGLEAMEANTSNDPRVRAFAKQNVQKEIQAGNRSLSQAGSFTVTVGPGIGVKGKIGKAELAAVANGPQLAVKVKSDGKVVEEGSIASAEGKLSTPLGSAKAGGVVGDITHEDGKFAADAVKAGARIELPTTSKEIKQGNLSEKASVNPEELSFGAKLGIIGLQVQAAPSNIVDGVIHWFGALFEYTKASADEQVSISKTNVQRHTEYENKK